ncbi:MAG: DUF4097 family beta strand repeat-containing protein [Candidatus Dependentiae bacterium]
MQKRIILHTGLLLVCAQALARVEEKKLFSYDFDARGELEVESGAGNVTVVGSDTHNKVTVEVTKRANTKEEMALFDAKIDISDKETKAKVRSDNLNRVANASIDFNVMVPRYTEVDAEVGSGNIVIQNIKGQMKAEAGSGNVTISGARKEVEVRVGSGDAQIAYAADGFGKTDVKVGSGSIQVTNAGGSVEAKSGSGAITIDQRILPHKEEIDAKTGAGNVKVSLPLEVNATVKAESKTGTIADGGLQWMRKPLKEGQPKPAGDKASVVLGKGYADVDLEAKIGSVSVSLK